MISAFVIQLKERLAAQSGDTLKLLFVQHGSGLIARLGALSGVGNQTPGRADQRLLTGAAVQVLVTFMQHTLQKIHGEVGTGNPHELTIADDRHGERREQNGLAANLVRCRVNHAGAQGFARAQIVFAGSDAVIENGLVLEIAQGFERQLTVLVSEPQRHVAASAVIAVSFDTFKKTVEVIQGVGLPAHIGIPQGRILLQRHADDAGHFFTSHHQRRHAITLNLAQHGIELRQLRSHSQRILKMATNARLLARGNRLNPILDQLVDQHP